MQLESNLMNAYHEAYRTACERLSKCDPKEVCLSSKAVLDEHTNTYTVKYLNSDYNVDAADGSVSLKNEQGNVTITEKVLLLHYLIHSKPEQLSGRNISFMEVPGGGAVYYSTFTKRAIDPLVKTFSDNIDEFKKASLTFNGTPGRFGNASSTIFIFPLVPVTYIIWQGDEEIASSGTILFDSSITNFLPVEDIVLAASFGAYRLMSKAKDSRLIK